VADPFTLAVAGAGASAGGSLISAFGALKGADAQSQQYQYQAGVARLNKQIALQNRDYAYATGETTARDYGMKAAQRQGTIRAGMSGQGIDIGSGSKAAVQESQRAVSKMDLEQIRNNTARKAYGYEVEATNNEAQAGLYERAASDAQSSGKIKALGSLISGAGSVADKWYQGSQAFGAGKKSNGGGDLDTDLTYSNYGFNNA
jgi:hypothetical protein